MTVKKIIEKLKEFPDDMEVLNHEYRDIQGVYEDVYPYIPTNAPESMKQTKYIIIN